MSSFGDQYILHAGRSGHARLRMISEIHDPATRELLTRAGLREGHRYIEFGCGLGYVTRWAGEFASEAIGIDLSEDQVSEASRLAENMPNVRFHRASIYEHGLEPESFDVSYSRWLLVHLTRPVDAMRQIYWALKPGGVMVCEEADVSTVYTEPPSAYHAFRDIAMESGNLRGVDYAGGGCTSGPGRRDSKSSTWARIIRTTWMVRTRGSGAGRLLRRGRRSCSPG